MALFLRINDQDFECSRAEVIRGVGIRTMLRCNLPMGDGVHVADLNRTLFDAAGHPKQTLLLDETPLVDGLSIESGYLSEDRTELVAVLELLPSASRAIRASRHTVYREQSILALIENHSSNLGFSIHDDLRDPFEEVKLPARSLMNARGLDEEYRDPACTIQTESNVTFVARLLGSYAAANVEGVVDRTAVGFGFVIQPSEHGADDAEGNSIVEIVALKPNGYLEIPTFELEGDLGVPHFGLYSQDEWAQAIPGCTIQHDSGRTVSYRRAVYDAQQIRQAISQRLPGKFESGDVSLFVHRISCVLKSRPGEPGATWETELIEFLEPSDVASASPCLQPYFGLGIVTGLPVEGSESGPWIQVRIDELSAEAALPARWQVPFSGTTGESGAVLYPAVGTAVTVHWSGYPGDPLVAGGNVRLKHSSNPAPALVFEDDLLIKCDRAHRSETAGEHHVTAEGELVVAAANEGMRLVGQGVELQLTDSKANVL